MSQLQQLNQSEEEQVKEDLLRCCGSTRWSKEMAKRRPFKNLEDCLKVAREVWTGLQPDDWLEAFSHHPRIGERGRPIEKWAEEEQGRVKAASQDALRALEIGNQEYEDKFGYVFLVCATGKSADEMLQLLRRRLDNPPALEIEIAAQEQMKITEIRLGKLVGL